MKEFSIERFLELAGPVEIADLDWELCRQVGVTNAEARILKYMADTESHTIVYMRDLLAGHSTKDPEIVQFLSVWVYEELCHGRAIAKLLKEAGHPVPEENAVPLPVMGNIRETIEAVLSQLMAWVTPKFISVHMTWGAINEATAAAAYQALERQTKNPVLATLCNRLARQERRHMSFYFQQAHKRMKADPVSQTMVRVAIRKFWTLVGSGVGGGENLDFVAAHLFNDEGAREPLRRAETMIRTLPGMDQFDQLVQQVNNCVDRYARSYGPVLSN